jgi:glycosyltransferase involved in cell wall biosynthesis
MLYGFGNQNEGGQALSYEQLKQALRINRVYFYTCTYPASYTMGFMEAWMTGTPIVAIGSKLAGWDWIEVPHMLKSGINGFTSDSIDELRYYIATLLDDPDLAKRVSSEGRKNAIDLFGKQKIKNEWKTFFDSL